VPRTVPAARRLADLVRLTHPFPSLLDGAVVVGVALVAGASMATATRLGLAMVALQFAIGALNDIVDAPRDVGRMDKPLATGLVGSGAAWSIVVVGLALGVLLSVPSGPAVVALALVGFGVGAAYDLRFKGTAWSWLPFAIGIPLLPVYAWLGVTGELPRIFVLLVPVAVLAGGALAIGNARADLATDAAAGTRSVATALGERGSMLVQAALFVTVVAVAAVALIAIGAPPPWLLVVGGSAALIGAGVRLSGSTDRGRRQRGWQLEAIGTGLLAFVWLAGIAPGPA
jgi:4-hydroxybenzoate polyprenyltransferase